MVPMPATFLLTSLTIVTRQTIFIICQPDQVHDVCNPILWLTPVDFVAFCNPDALLAKKVLAIVREVPAVQGLQTSLTIFDVLAAAVIIDGGLDVLIVGSDLES